VQDFEAPHTDTFDLPIPNTVDDDTVDVTDKPSERPPQREGLPAHYRMRAERHYVDSITSASAGVPIRLLALTKFAPLPESSVPPDALMKSIRVHGIIQPLLVRKQHAQYEVIAGKRRFAAAAALGLTEVPCVLHQVDDEAAAALSAAENLHVNQPPAALRASVGAHIAEAISRIADDAGRLQASLEALRAAPDGFERTIAGDLSAAQAARIQWLANTAALLAGGRCRPGKRRPFAAIVDDVVRRFEPESRLAGLRIDVESESSMPAIDDCFVTAALTSAVMLTLSLLEHVPQPVIRIITEPLEPGGVSVHVLQHHVPASPDVVERFTTRSRSVWTPMIFALGALALEHATAAHGGAADLLPLDENGSAIQLTFCRS
jgi:hypothetical protein